MNNDNTQLSDPSATSSPEAQSSFSYKQNNWHAIKVFIFEITIILLGLFAALTLNYFNILPLSRTFPKQLSWLPYQKPITQEKVGMMTTGMSSVPIPTPTFSTVDGSEIPIALGDSSLNAVSLNYTLIGIVKEIKSEGDIYILKLDYNLKNPKIPQFKLDKNTEAFAALEGDGKVLGKFAIKLDTIRVNDTVALILGYNFSDKQLLVYQVKKILQKEGEAFTPSVAPISSPQKK